MRRSQSGLLAQNGDLHWRFSGGLRVRHPPARHSSVSSPWSAAQAVGLALHELATNASKYGALSTETGAVEVCWRLDNDVFAMNRTERGGPLVSAPTHRGFGSTVVNAMAKRSVQGEVHLDYAPSGVVWTLTCSPANALEAAEGELERAPERLDVS